MQLLEEARVAHRPGPRERVTSETVRRAQRGDAAAFEEVALEYAPRAYRMLVIRLGNEQDARDALQETLLAAWQGLPRLREPELLWAWLAGIAARKAVDAARRRPKYLRDRSWNGTLEDACTSVALRTAIRALPEHLRDVVLLRFVAELSEEQTASALRIRVGTVKSRAARARKALSEVMT